MREVAFQLPWNYMEASHMQLEVWMRSSDVNLCVRNTEEADEVNKDEPIQGETIAEKGETNNNNQEARNTSMKDIIQQTLLFTKTTLLSWTQFSSSESSRRTETIRNNFNKYYKFYDKGIYRVSGYIKEKVENLTWEIGLNDEWGLHEHKELLSWDQ